MSGKVSIGYAGRVVDLLAGETVLDCLERHALPVRSSCRTGACQSCLLRVTEGQAPAASQKTLRPSLRDQGYFLACQARPESAIACVPADELLPPVQATVRQVERLSSDIVALHLDVPNGFSFRGGQFVHLEREDGVSRSYSIANLPSDRRGIELHVRKIPGGAMSSWIHEVVQPGEKVTVRGPVGDCTYDAVLEGHPTSHQAPLVLAGVGTGMAPLLAVAREAVSRGHEGPIRVYQGGLHPGRLYLSERFADVLRPHANARQALCVLQGTADGVRTGPLADVVIEDLGAMLKQSSAILCGDGVVVNQLRKKLFLAGVSLKRLYADAFVPAASSQKSVAPVRAAAQ